MPFEENVKDSSIKKYNGKFKIYNISEHENGNRTVHINGDVDKRIEYNLYVEG